MNRKARTARCYVQQELQAPAEVELDKRTSHHLSTVLRAKIGMNVQLFNGDGNNYSGEIIATGKKTQVQLSDVSASGLESALRITLVQAIARGDKMDGIIQKATELGVSQIQPVYTKQSISQLDANREVRKREHWEAIAISASEQSGRCVLPTMHTPLPLQTFLDSLGDSHNNEARWILSPVANANDMGSETVVSASLLIGPESGFENEELQAAKAASFSELQLGPRVLRTETAGPAAIAVLQSKFGDLS